MIFPMLVGKLFGGITAVAVAMLIAPKSEAQPEPVALPDANLQRAE
jgi:ethanolamine transporter